MSDDPREIPTAAVPIGPEAIVDYDLPKAKRGYDRDAVDELLDRLAVQTAGLVAEVAALRADRGELLAELARGSEAETTLKKTLVTAQRAAEASIEEARGHADAIRSRALERAEEILQRASAEAQELREAALRRARADEADARRRRRALDDHVDTLRAFAEDHRRRVAHHLQQQLERLEAMETPAPPPPPAPLADDVVDEPVLSREVDDLVADIDAAVGDEAAGSPRPPAAAPPGATPDTGVAPPTAPPGEQALSIVELLARVDDAASEAGGTARVVADDDLSGGD